VPILYRFRSTVGRFIYGCADFLRLALKSWQAALNGSVKSIREQAKDEISIRRASCRDRRFLTEATNGKASAVRGVPRWTASCSLSRLATSEAMRRSAERRAPTCFKSNYDMRARLHLICLRWWIDLSALITVVYGGTWVAVAITLHSSRHCHSANSWERCFSLRCVV